MKSSAIISWAVAAHGAPVSPTFEAFKVAFGKTYPSAVAEAQAKACWQENVADITQRLEANSGVQFAENEFIDQCWEDFVAERAPLDMSNGICYKSPIPGYTKKEDETKNVDWRTSGYVNPVKDQKSCGSCWAFSAVGALEGAHFKATGKLVSLSEQQLVSCDPGNNGCNGGMPGEAFAYAQRNGMSLEASYPYEAKTSGCKSTAKPVHFSDWFYIPSKGKGGEHVLLAALQNEGPVSITVQANQAWHSYAGGIMDIDTCPNFGSINHAVLAVGYGEEAGKKYWIVRNSWGTGWGESGYIRMAYDHGGVCGMTSCLAAVPVGSSAANSTLV